MTHASRFLYWRFSDSMRSWVWRLVLFMILTDFASFRDTLTTNSMSPDFCCISILCSAVACPNKPAIVLRPLFPSVAMTAHISVSGRKSHGLWNEFIMTKTICKSRTLHVEAQRVRMYVCVCVCQLLSVFCHTVAFLCISISGLCVHAFMCLYVCLYC